MDNDISRWQTQPNTQNHVGRWDGQKGGEEAERIQGEHEPQVDLTLYAKILQTVKAVQRGSPEVFSRWM